MAELVILVVLAGVLFWCTRFMLLTFVWPNSCPDCRSTTEELHGTDDGQVCLNDWHFRSDDNAD